MKDKLYTKAESEIMFLESMVYNNSMKEHHYETIVNCIKLVKNRWKRFVKGGSYKLAIYDLYFNNLLDVLRGGFCYFDEFDKENAKKIKNDLLLFLKHDMS
jgi:hypothetical protein